uniref:Uncharacterized protein n=1 Tax=Helianthus annuus TaxID=4232 RepID=A0A251SWW1_HELAN
MGTCVRLRLKHVIRRTILTVEVSTSYLRVIESKLPFLDPLCCYVMIVGAYYT